MNFICDQNWNAMRSSANGRHCDICKKEVIDFRNKSLAEVNKLEKGVCGIFLPEHVEDGLIPIKLNFISKTKYYVATIATLIGLESHTLRAQDQKELRAKTEIVADDKSQNKSDLSYEETDSSKYDENDTDQLSPPDTKDFMRIGRRYFYWSKRFPFIRSRKEGWMGAKF
ncbi:MAG: hypothetical protein ACXVPU_02235 [Bacteroidia bacterium]